MKGKKRTAGTNRPRIFVTIRNYDYNWCSKAGTKSQIGAGESTTYGLKIVSGVFFVPFSISNQSIFEVFLYG
jgi:hypothetical protein